MKIIAIDIHNFRSIKDASFLPRDYSVILGANNSGKSNLLTAIRIFYEDGIKFTPQNDMPKFDTKDNESWIEIEYSLADNEFENLKDIYKRPNNSLRVRKYLKSDDRNKVKTNQSNIYAYEGETLSENLFYGAKNISESKLGNVIYIPEITKTDDTLKLSGPSPLRNVITFVMKKVVKKSESYEKLNQSFEEFNRKFREESSKDGFSLEKMSSDINDNLKEWDVEFKIDINSVRPEDVIKNLITHYALDKSIKKEIDIKNLGQGLQRHIIYTLLKLSSKYVDEKKNDKKEFSPEFTLILFEEPEAFLHPGMQDNLNSNLRSLSIEEGQQIIATTHSPFFVSKNIEDIPSLINLKKNSGETQMKQVSQSALNNIFKGNNELAKLLEDKLQDESIQSLTKRRIQQDILGETDNDKRMEEESIRYLLWIDSERCCSFFSDTVLLCEGATEKVFIEYLMRNKWQNENYRKIYIMDTMGKFNIHRYMNLFSELGINHSVLADKDENNDVHEIINQFIKEKKNTYTKKIDFFDKDIETFLGIETTKRRDKKPLNIIWHYFSNKIPLDKIDELEKKVMALI